MNKPFIRYSNKLCSYRYLAQDKLANELVICTKSIALYDVSLIQLIWEGGHFKMIQTGKSGFREMGQKDNYFNKLNTI